jgi:UDP-xylose/UDP-N-acetylglucosamine transporter B4
MAMAGRIFIETIPQWLTMGMMMALIFGGCCSNVSDLSAYLRVGREAHNQSITGLCIGGYCQGRTR